MNNNCKCIPNQKSPHIVKSCKTDLKYVLKLPILGRYFIIFGLFVYSGECKLCNNTYIKPPRKFKLIILGKYI